jgi:hypothetical protein
LAIAVENIEAIAVSRQGDRYLFIYAERADQLREYKNSLDGYAVQSLKIGGISVGNFRSPFGSGENIRPISDLAVDKQGMST